jgi:hypothetical protein
MVDAVQPRKRAAEGRSSQLAGKPLLIRILHAFGRRLLRAMQEWRRRQAAIVVQEYLHVGPPRSGGDHDV